MQDRRSCAGSGSGSGVLKVGSGDTDGEGAPPRGQRLNCIQHVRDFYAFLLFDRKRILLKINNVELIGGADVRVIQHDLT